MIRGELDRLWVGGLGNRGARLETGRRAAKSGAQVIEPERLALTVVAAKFTISAKVAPNPSTLTDAR
jgi:hypothetical protein